MLASIIFLSIIMFSWSGVKLQKAVLFIVFNRLDVVQKVFEQIKAAAPPRLYISSDGARENKPGEHEVVENVRKWVLENITWQCEVKTKFNSQNLGCGKGVSSAITWFFENEPDGIILEDDCVPNLSFFGFCEELLDYYKNDKRVWQISGSNLIEMPEYNASYYFSKIEACWGWASWADRWQHFTFDLKDYDKKHVKNISRNKDVQRYWRHILYQIKEGKNDHVWDTQWLFNIIASEGGGFCVNPHKNLISNIGMTGTHYESASDNPHLNKDTYSIGKIVHPEKVEFNEAACEMINEVCEFKRSKSVATKDILSYMRKRPLFLFKEKFWEKFWDLVFDQ